MISKAKQRLIKSLQSKKIRQKQQSFLVQGEKGVVELLNSKLNVRFVLATEDFIEKNSAVLGNTELVHVSPSELKDLGTLEVNDRVLAVADIPQPNEPTIGQNDLILILDSVKDPGNLGTIVRTADWFGVRTIIASKGTVDFYNPKVINATMGSFTRVEVVYTDLQEFVNANRHIKYIGADMEGKDASEFTFERPCAICLGSESHGISNSIRSSMDSVVSVKRVGEAESLNVAIAAGILLHQACR